jgi:hypothetical protein
MRQRALLLACTLAASGCSRVDAPAPSKAVESPAALQPVAPPVAAAAPKAATLAERYPDWRVGVACQDDRQCDGALRCEAAQCDFPSAMTGRATGVTAAVEVMGAGGGARFDLEVADQSWEEMRGLMFRREMAKGWGMIFVFANEAPRSFWMKDTLMPLDMVFVRADGVVDSVVASAEPLTLTPRRSTGPAKYVVELASGVAATAGIVAGRRLVFDNLPAGPIGD